MKILTIQTNILLLLYICRLAIARIKEDINRLQSKMTKAIRVN